MISDATSPTGTSATSRIAGTLIKLAPVSFMIAGAVTGSTYAAAPPSLLDWTSSDVHRVETPGVWALRDVETSRTTATQTVLESIKRDSGLTWGQIAHALEVEVRTIHLWRNGGGISAAHETRLRGLAFLVETLRLREPSDVRSDLVDAQMGDSLLDRFRAGADSRELALLAPWRIEAREGLARNMASRASSEPVDEDFGFLLYGDDSAASAFAATAEALLAAPTTSRREWESELDKQFGEVEQPETIDVPAEVHAEVFDDDDVDRYGAPPLFGLDDLGISLGVGAIASRPTIGEER